MNPIRAVCSSVLALMVQLDAQTSEWKTSMVRGTQRGVRSLAVHILPLMFTMQSAFRLGATTARIRHQCETRHGKTWMRPANASLAGLDSLWNLITTETTTPSYVWTRLAPWASSDHQRAAMKPLGAATLNMIDVIHVPM